MMMIVSSLCCDVKIEVHHHMRAERKQKANSTKRIKDDLVDDDESAD